jgi:hypothetical protein
VLNWSNAKAATKGPTRLATGTTRKSSRWETYDLKADADKRDAEIKIAKQRGEPIPKRGKRDAGETLEAFAYESWWPNYVQANKMVEKTLDAGSGQSSALSTDQKPVRRKQLNEQASLTATNESRSHHAVGPSEKAASGRDQTPQTPTAVETPQTAPTAQAASATEAAGASRPRVRLAGLIHARDIYSMTS